MRIATIEAKAADAVDTTASFVERTERTMSRVRTAPTIQNIIEDMHGLSEGDQRALDAAIIDDRKLEAFVEELEDHLGCEAAAEEDSEELFSS